MIIKRIGVWCILLALLFGSPAGEVRAQTPPPDQVSLAKLTFYVVGLNLRPSPERQAVPKDVTTIVNTELLFGTDAVNFADIQAQLPADLIIKGELRGPAFPQPLSLQTKPNVPFTLPTLPLVGIYTLENIRMMSGDQIIAASPNVVTIESFQQALITQVTTRPMTAQEIQDQGLLIDQSSFQVMDFTIGLATESNPVTITFPVAVPISDPDPELSVDGGFGLNLEEEGLVDFPQIETEFPNIVVKGFVMDTVEVAENDGELAFPPISGLIIIPGNIAFLNQFFNVNLLVTNGAPANSGLTVQNIQAKIVLPPGEDRVSGTDDVPGDDPLRVARKADGTALHILPVVGAGVDGRTGTGDDLTELSPGQSGQADFIVEGLREGAFAVDFELTATLVGLPRGPVEIKGKASGTVLVRNPNFTLTLSHPRTVRAGIFYTLFATITNSSDAPANYVSISLDPRGVSGAELVSDSVVQVESIPPRSAATVSFRMRSQVTGEVTANVFQSDGNLKGKFILRTGVGDNGIPFSPDTLVLPDFVNELPAELVAAGIGFLGEAYSVATAPVGALPSNIDRIGRSVVDAKAIALSEAGLRLLFQESLIHSAENLLVDFLGGETPDAAFDALRRQSYLSAEFNVEIGKIFKTEVDALGGFEFQRSLAETTFTQGKSLSVWADGGALRMQLQDDLGNRLGQPLDGIVTDALLREIPHADLIEVESTETLTRRLALITPPVGAAYTATLVAASDGPLSLGVVFPDNAIIRQVTYGGISLLAGDRVIVSITLTGTAGVQLQIDRGNNGTIDETVTPSGNLLINDPGPVFVGAMQITQFDKSDKYGRLIGLLFSQKLDPSSVQSLANYAVDGNAVRIVQVQPGKRLIFLLVRDPIGPYVERQATVSGLRSLAGVGMSPSVQTQPIVATITTPGGVLSGRVLSAEGAPIGGALVTLKAFEENTTDPLLFGEIVPVPLAQKTVDADGKFQFDYVQDQFQIEATNPNSNDRELLGGQIRYPGEQIALDLIMRGKGSVSGKVTDADGLAVPGAAVRISSFVDSGEVRQQVTTADGLGGFAFQNVPVGNFRLEAVFQNAAGQVNGLLDRAGLQVKQDVSIFVTTAATGNLTGRVFASDGVTPVARVVVFASRNNNVIGYAYTDETGAYTLENLTFGGVTLQVTNPATKETGRTATTVIANETTTAMIYLIGLANISGTVYSASGVPLEGVYVQGPRSWAFTDFEGKFLLQGVALGNVGLSAVDPKSGKRGSTVVTLSIPGETAGASIFLAPAASLVGVVYARDGVTPVPGAEVRIIMYEGGGLCLCEVGYILTTTDAQGGYRFDDLPLDSHSPVIAVKDGEAGNTDYHLSFDGQILIRNIVMAGRGTVTGTVTDPGSGGMPVGANIAIAGRYIDGAGRIKFGNIGLTQSDPETGRFRFDGLLPGPFTVTAANTFRPTPVTVTGTILGDGDLQDVEIALKVNAGSIAGTVFLPDGVSTAEGIRVTLQLNGQPVTVTTDPEGRFQFAPILPAGAYALVAEDPATGLKGTTNVVVQAGGEVTPTFRLLGRGTVIVQAKTSLGGPLQNGTVTLARTTFPFDQASGTLTPANNGEIQFAQISEGTFALTVRDPNGLGGRAEGLLPADGATATIEVRTAPSGTVRGRFLSPDGLRPIPNGQMILRLNGATIGFDTTSSDPSQLGRFLFENVPFGSVSLDGFDPITGRKGLASSAVARDGQVLILDVLQLRRGTVEGTLLSGNGTAPVAGANITLTSQGAYGLSFQATTLPDGAFSFPGVNEGAFTLRANVATTGLSASASGAITREGDRVQVTMRLQPSGFLEGTVYQADGTTPAPFAQINISGANYQANENGFYRVGPWVLGTYSIQASELNGPDGAIGSATLTAEGQTVVTDLRFNGAGSIGGIVYDSDGTTPLAGGIVRLTVLGPFGLTAQTESGPDGSYHFPRVPVGLYSLSVSEPGGLLGGTARGTLTQHGQAVTVNVTLQGAGRVIGRMLRPDRTTPVTGGVATLSGAGYTVNRPTEADGEFRFEGIPLGSWTLVLQDPYGMGIARAAGSLDQNGEEENLGGIALDDQAIRVASITPADGTVNLPLSTTFTIDFSEEADLATLTGSHFRLMEGGSVVATTLTIQENGKRVVLTPTAPLKGFSVYTVMVMTGVRDRIGFALPAEFRATYQTIDNVPPSVLSISPTPGRRQVPLDTVVRIVLSEPVDDLREMVGGGNGNHPATATNVILSGPAGNVEGRIDLINNQTVIVLTPLFPLSANQTYTVRLSGLKDLTGNLQSLPYLSIFDTLDTIPPTVTGVTLVGNPTLIYGTTVTVMATAADSDIAYFDFLANGPGNGTATSDTLVGSDGLAPYTASVLLIPAQGNQVTIKAIATDRAGNKGVPGVLTLEVVPDVAPTLTLAPSANEANVGTLFGLSVSGSDDVAVSEITLALTGAVNGAETKVNPSRTATFNTVFSIPIPTTVPVGSLLNATVTVKDIGGKSATATRSFAVVDTLAPRATLTGPAGGKVITGQSAALTVEVSDPGRIRSVTLSASNGQITGTNPLLLDPAVDRVSAQYTWTASTTIPIGEIVTVTATAEDLYGNVGVSGVVSLRVVPVPPTLAAITAVAATGTPADPAKPSANVGQIITLTGTDLRADVLARVTTRRADGTLGATDLPVLPGSVSPDGTAASVLLDPASGVATGPILWFDPISEFTSSASLVLQIVPTIDRLDAPIFGSLEPLTVIGNGLMETVSRITFTGAAGPIQVNDNGPSLDAFDANRKMTLLIPFGVVDGPITVTTDGGQSAPFALRIPRLSAISAVAATGIPADPAKGSANVGQTVTIQGTGLQAGMALRVTTVDENGVKSTGTVPLTSVAGDGLSAQAVLSLDSVTTGPVRLFDPAQGIGSASSRTLQIVPTLSEIAPDNLAPGNLVTLNGSGFVENGMTALFPAQGGTTSVIDAGFNADVAAGNRSAILTMPTGVVPGLLKVTTNGGTSAPLAIGRNEPIVLLVTPDPISLKSGETRTIMIALSRVDFFDRMISVSVEDPAVATAGTATLTIPTGAIGTTVTLTAQASGTTALVLQSDTVTKKIPLYVAAPPTDPIDLQSPSVGVFVASPTAPPVATIYEPIVSPPLGVDLQTAPSSSSTTVSPVTSLSVGVSVGPSITGLLPGSGEIGTIRLDLTVVGVNLFGAASVELIPATGLTVLEAPVIAPDGGSLVVGLSIAADAPTGVKTIIVRTASGTILPATAGANTFQVTLPQPEIFSMSPITKGVGSSFTLTLNGKNLTGATAVAFNPPNDISVGNPPTVSSDGKTATVDVTVGAGAAVGTRIVTITTSAATTTLTASPANSFTITATPGTDYSPLVSPSVGVVVTPPATTTTTTFDSIVAPVVGVAKGPAVSGLSPNSGIVGTTMTLRVWGVALDGVTSVVFVPSTGITAGSVTVSPDGTQVSVPITIEADAPTTLRTVAVKAGLVTLPVTTAGANLFRVTLPPPEIDSITPITKGVGSSFTLTLNGRNFNGATAVAFDPPGDVSIGNPPTVSADGTTATVNVTLGAAAATGSRVVAITTPAGTTPLTPSPANSFTITATPGTDYSSLVSPAVGVVVTPPSTTTTTTFDSIVAPQVGLQVESSGSTATTTYTPIVAANVGVAVGESLSKVTPNVGTIGESDLTLVIEGSDLSLVTSVELVPATGVAVQNPPVIAADGKSLTTFITIAPDAPLGVRRVVVSTFDGEIEPSAAGVNLFTVGPPTPDISSVTPISAVIGNTFTMTIRGRNLTGATEVTFTPPDGISVGSPLVNFNGTEATVSVSLSMIAPDGPRLVQITTPNGTSDATASPANTFRVYGSGSGRLYWWEEDPPFRLGFGFLWAGLISPKSGVESQERLIPVARTEVEKQPKRNRPGADLWADRIWSLKLITPQGIRGRPPTG
jgi:hypothetical protein